MTRALEIHLTELDVARLERVLMDIIQREGAEPQGVAALEAMLDEAEVVPSASIDPQVVTMNSTVVLESRPHGRKTKLTLAYPKDADPEQGRVSVLSPLGRALLGARVGESIRIVVPGQGEREMTVAELEYQPEAAGRFDL